jgi:hypothetical protein
VNEKGFEIICISNNPLELFFDNDKKTYGSTVDNKVIVIVEVTVGYDMMT